MPYDDAALAECLHGRPTSACSPQTARMLAMAAYQKAKRLSPDETVYGLGCTAALATNRDRRGADRCHIALQSADRTIEINVALTKSSTRQAQELICSGLIIDAMADMLDLTITDTDTATDTNTDNADATEYTVVKNAHVASSAWQKLLDQAPAHSGTNDVEVLFPGAFNPFHHGHRQMIECAEQLLGKKVSLEISIRNVDKPTLDFIEMAQRERALEAVDCKTPLIYSNTPTFREKSWLFPGVTFIVGLDTMTRIADKKYYSGDPALRDKALDELVSRGHHFLVFGRLENTRFITLDDIDLPKNLRGICQGVTEAQFRADVSSTSLRAEMPETESPPVSRTGNG